MKDKEHSGDSALGLPMEKVEGEPEQERTSMWVGLLCVLTDHVCTGWIIWQMLH